MPWEVPTEILLDEWKLLQLECDEEGSRNKRFVLYWLQFMEIQDFNSSPKYPTENADAVRSLSPSCRPLTPARSTMSERTLNAPMTAKSTLLTYDNKPHLIPISKELLDIRRVAYKSYNAYNEEERRVAEEENRKMKNPHKNTEANERLKKALRNKNQAALAQAMIGGVAKVQE
ncbi:hypothetical protein PR048_004102 [Dryococelus australis]|uniref:Uncharacterized protein n=1 Tax=Dryococelus australis TaxID=614101 RepID=A0ABQ9I4J4_9NEOP|nr:hypothetical protein PR048_004102 [Dryococelus australis]